MNTRYVKLLICLCALVLSLAANAGAQDAPSHVEQIVEANSLDVNGKTPFHLKIAFQLYDMDGKPTDTGTIEEWWVAPGMSKTLIMAQSLNSTVAVPFDDGAKLDPRENYLLHRLLSAEVHPINGISSNRTRSVNEANRSFGKINLDCVKAAQGDGHLTGMPLENFCVDPKDNALRVQFEESISTTVRNSPGNFHGTNVSLDLSISFEERLAITGKVTALQSYDPAKSEIVLSTPPITEASKPTASGSIKPGRKLDDVHPEYPSLAKASRISGTVILHAVISKQGKITGLFPVASPSPILTGAAMEAVKRWTYSPFLLNGEPTDVETTINVSFNFGS